jgi:Xaa-Pro dipeptidase
MIEVPVGEHASPPQFAGRRQRARERLVEQAHQACWLLLTSLPNVAYLTGFTGSNAVFALHAADPARDLLGTDGRYVDQVRDSSPDLEVVIDRGTLAAVVRRLSTDAGQVCVESSIALGDWQVVCRDLGGPVSSLDGLVEDLRVVKDEWELATLERACRITAEAFAVLFTELRPGLSEVFVARRLEQIFGDLGAQDRAFPTIVGSGPNSAIPHHQCSPRTLQPGDLVVVDAGALVDGYHADMTRTAVVGTSPSDWQRQIHELVLHAQSQARALVMDGVPVAELDHAARGPIEAAGFGPQFSHGLGHGVGLAIHEAPMLSARATGSVCAGTPITIEPGIYLAGRGGVRIEDTLVVESSGARVLTELPRELACIG